MSPASFQALPTLAAFAVICAIMSRSPPAENARPAPVTTTTLVSSSSATSSHTRLNSKWRRLLVALSTSGRLIVMSRTASSIHSNTRCWYSLYFIFSVFHWHHCTPLNAPSAFVNVDDLAEQRDRFGLRTLTAVAADDGAET